jgi:hypothetical protein
MTTLEYIVLIVGAPGLAMAVGVVVVHWIRRR